MSPITKKQQAMDNCQSYEKTVRSYSCPHLVQLLFISGSSSPGAVFFLLLDLGPGAAAGGMGIEINTGYSCYLLADIYP